MTESDVLHLGRTAMDSSSNNVHSSSAKTLGWVLEMKTQKISMKMSTGKPQKYVRRILNDSIFVIAMKKKKKMKAESLKRELG